jgi:beta-fructofuranosidase
LTLARRESKGWTGCLALPREVFLLTIDNVLGTLKTPLAEIPSLRIGQGENGTHTVQTLGIRPLKNVASLRTCKPRVWMNLTEPSGHLATPPSASWELEATIRVHPSHRRVGFHLNHNSTMSERTSVYFSPQEEFICVEREASNAVTDIVKDNLHGPFTLFVREYNGEEILEKLHLRIFTDGDVLEVFANDRFALSTVVYANAYECTGLSFFAEGDVGGEIAFGSISLWDGMSKVQAGV